MTLPAGNRKHVPLIQNIVCYGRKISGTSITLCQIQDFHCLEQDQDQLQKLNYVNNWCWLCIVLDLSKCLSKTSSEVENCNDLIWVQRNINSIWRDYFISILKCFKEAILKHKAPWIVTFQDRPDWNDSFFFNRRTILQKCHIYVKLLS